MLVYSTLNRTKGTATRLVLKFVLLVQAHKADASPWTSVWTAQGRPSDLVLRRMVAFADAALKAMQQSLSFENIWSDEYVPASFPAVAAHRS
jgi:hypothetical protein